MDLPQNLAPTQPMPPQPQPDPNMAPVPASPAEATGLTQEQMKANLQDLMDKIQGKYQDFNTQKFSSDNKVKASKAEELRALFDIFQQAGVDPSNVEEVKAFLDKIKASNPEMYQQLEKVLQEIVGDDTSMEQSDGSAPDMGMDPSQNMNINTNDPTQQNI